MKGFRQPSVSNGSPDSPNESGDMSASMSGTTIKQRSDGVAIKPQKACSACRKSKVRCVHDGGPPCKRCVDTNQECKFRLRADDEAWRERTDETLNKLASAVDTIIARGLPPPTPPPARPMMPMRNASAPGVVYGAPQPPPPLAHYSPGSQHGSNASTSAYHPAPSHHRTPFSNGLPPLTSPHSDGAIDVHSPSIDTAAGSSAADILSPDRRMIPRKREAPASDGEQSNQPHYHPSHHHHQPQSPQTPSNYSRQRGNSASLMPPPLPPSIQHQDQIAPSPVINHILSSGGQIYVHGLAPGPRWMMGQTTSYAKATMAIGREDPRMNVISIGVIPMERARTLFMFFAEKMQPHSFGFPTYPAAEQMTPVIISAILTVASLHEPFSRQYHQALKNDCIGHIKPDQTVVAEMPLDPELGIGVEEITGACIASAWLGGELGWRIARVSRWWTIGYLKHFELPDRNLTVGECLTILPPFRQIDLVDKLRIFLAAYVAEAQQAFILDRPSLVPEVSPMPYVDALRNAFNDVAPQTSLPHGNSNGSGPIDTRGIMTGGGGSGSKYPPPPDRQLTGHASMLFILLEAQRNQREARWASTEEHRFAHHHPSEHAHVDPLAVHECVDRLIGLWMMWMEETEHWKAEASSLEDLSSSTASAMDLTLTYHLTKAHLGSLALEPEYKASPAVSRLAARDPRFVQMQTNVINTAKTNAMAALQLAVSHVGFRDRLLYLPGFYQFLLGHSAGFLLLLLQRKNRFMLAGEGKIVLETVENFVSVYTSDFATHSFHPHASASVHAGMATAEALARACQHVRSQARGV